jgi:alpha-2-macroglobulin
MTRKRSARLSAAASCVILLSCATTMRPFTPQAFPEPVAGRSLGPTGPGSWIARPEPLAVIHRSPTGTAEGTAAILVTFNQPMVRLGPVGETPAATNEVLRISPPVSGALRWISGDTAKLALDRPLQNAQTYRLTVSPTLRSLSGQRLGTEESWTFETPRPKLLRVEPRPKEKQRFGRVLPDDSLLLTFNLRVEPPAVERRLVLRVNKQTAVVEVSRGEQDPKRVLVRPSRPLPPGAQLELELAAGLVSSEGPLPSAKRHTERLVTRRPLTVAISCDGQPLNPTLRCWPMRNGYSQGLQLELSEPVRLRDLQSALRITPATGELRKHLKVSWDQCPRGDPDGPCARSFQLERDLLPNRAYEVHVAASLVDVFGQRLDGARRERFSTRDLPPGIFLAGHGLLREPWQPVRFKAVNIKRLEVRARRQVDGDLVRFLECRQRQAKSEGADQCVAGPLTPPKTLQIAAAVNQVVDRPLELPLGLTVLTVQSPQVVDHAGAPILFRRVVNLTDLGLQARLTAFGLTAWVTSLRSGQPVRGARVEVFDQRAERLWSGRTGPQGVVEAAGSSEPLAALLAAPKPPTLYVVASSSDGRDQTYVRIMRDHRDEYGEEKPLRAEALWRKTWAAHDDLGPAPEQRIDPQEIASFTAWEGERVQLAGYISTERGIYRPGQTLHAHGALRRYRSWRGGPAAGQLVHVQLLGRDGEVIIERRVRTSALGVFRQTLPLPAEGRLGYHSVLLLVDGKFVASHWLRIEEYREPPFSVTARVSPREVREGDPLTVDLEARYLFGGAMDGAAYRLSINRSTRPVSFPGHPGYHAGAYSWEVEETETVWLRREGTLDAAGRAHLVVPLRAAAHHPWPCYQTVEAEVSSVDRQTIAARAIATQNPGELYVALATTPSEKNNVRRKLLVVTPRGVAVGGRTVTATLHPTRQGTYSRPDWSKTVWSTTLTVPEKGTTVVVPWPAAKDHLLHLRLAVRDDAGREAWTTSAVRRPEEYSRKWEEREDAERKRTAQLTLTLDRKRYLPGETATVTVQHRGPLRRGLLLVERERTFQTLPLQLDGRGRATVKIAVDESLAPAVQLRALLPRSGKALRDPYGPLLVATAELRVSDKPFHLQVGLKTDRPRYHPGERVQVGVEVRDRLDRPRRAEVVLMAVDEAVLQLTAFELPDPLSSLLRAPAEGVLADDARHRLLSLTIPMAHRDHAAESFGLGGLGLRGTGRGGGAGYGHGSGTLSKGKEKETVRRRFVTTAWHASLVTDEQGRARTSFTLPDNLTRYRIMAFAVDDQRSSGTGKTSLEVDLPLVTLPAVPRLLRVGDRARAGVVVHNTALPAGTVRVRARVDGNAAVLDGPSLLEARLGPGQQRELRFGVRALKPGEVRLRFSVEMGAVRDALEHTLVVKRPLLPETAAVAGETVGAVRQGIAPLEGLVPDHGGLEVSLASTALTGVEDGMEQLIEYPYGCLEQKSSRLLPMLAALALGERFALKLPGQPRDLVQRGISDILGMQRSDGGFGYWPSSSLSDPWATAYALIVLHRAKLAGRAADVSVPARRVERALSYLRSYLKTKDLGLYEFSYRSFIFYALALHGQSITTDALELYDRPERGRKPLFARAMLLAALVSDRAPLPKSTQIGLDRPLPVDAAQQAAARGRAISALARELSDSLRVDGTHAHAEENLHDGYKILMHSDDRTTAMVLLALLAAQPSHPMITRVVRWFLLGRKQARFRNTQEAAWALLGLWDYARLREKEVPDFEAGVWLGDQRLVTAHFRGRSVKPVLSKRTMQELLKSVGRAAQDLVVGKRGSGTLYYAARLRYARAALPAQARDHGFAVKRSVQVLDRAGQPLRQQRPPRAGDTLLVTVEVRSSEARRYVVVEDPLPAGLEALDATLATGSRTFGELAAWLRSSRWDHRELRDDRVLFFRDLMEPGALTYRYLARVSFAGDFIAPPPRVEEMYTPEVFGHGAAARVSYPE